MSSSGAKHGAKHGANFTAMASVLCRRILIFGSLFCMGLFLPQHQEGSNILQAASPVRVHQVKIINRFPHDPKAFTQGLVFIDGVLIEGTGQYGKSQLREVDIATGKVKRSLPLHRTLFGEGIALVKDEIYQITWKKGLAIVYDRKTFREKRRHAYRGEGWGLTYDGTSLIMSNGSNEITFRDPKTFRVKRRIRVRHNTRVVQYINELEYIDGEIYANIWQSDYIARINPRNGKVLGWIDISRLNTATRAERAEKVSNGIAYDAKKKRLFLTGKHWNVLYEVKVIGNK